MRRPRRTSESARQRRRRERREREAQVERWMERQLAEPHPAYDTSPLVMEGEAAERMADILVERGLAKRVKPKPKKVKRPGRGGKRPRSTDKDLDKMLAKVWEAGWRMEPGGTNHIKVWRPDGDGIISVPLSPRGSRTQGRIRGQLRQAGLDI